MQAGPWCRRATDYEDDAKIKLFIQMPKYLLLSLEFIAYFKNVLHIVYYAQPPWRKSRIACCICQVSFSGGELSCIL